MTHRPRPEIAVVLKGYPRLSETFIAQELLALERRGVPLRIFSLRHPTDRTVHPVHREIRAPVHYLPEYLHDDPARVFAAWRIARRRPGYAAARSAWLADLKRDPTRNRVRRFGQACVLATELPPGTPQIHAHFLHTPASVARYAAMITGLPWSCSAHAKDIWTSPDWEKREKLADVAWLVTCTEAGRAHLADLAPDSEARLSSDGRAAIPKVSLVYHGLDFTRFPRRPQGSGSGALERNGAAADDPVVLLSVGRAVAKKGYDVLLHALRDLPRGLSWRLVHIGGGAERSNLQALGRELGLEGRISWRGPLGQEDVLAAYGEADLFVLASRIAADGDRDGLPNVLMEAQSQRLACLATNVSGIPELIEDGETGLLIPPDDRTALTQALQRLIIEPELRRRLAQAGEARVHSRFDMSAGIDDLAARFDRPGLTRAAE